MESMQIKELERWKEFISNLQSIKIQSNEQSNQSNFDDIYELTDKIGEGTNGIVRKAIRKIDNKKFAVKIIRAQDEELVQTTIKDFKIVKHLDHPSIVKAHELYIDQVYEKVYYVMELIDGKSLSSLIKHSHNYSNEEYEHKVAIIITQLLQTVQYMHQHFIAHRDIKPQNILYDTLDFGVSRTFVLQDKINLQDVQKQTMYTDTGTLCYKAPEMYENEGYSRKVDTWAVGVLTFQLLTGNLPFFHEHAEETIKLICQGKVDFNPQIFNFSQNAKNFIQRLLQSDPSKRLSAKSALKHPWILIRNLTNAIIIEINLVNLYKKVFEFSNINNLHNQISQQLFKRQMTQSTKNPRNSLDAIEKKQQMLNQELIKQIQQLNIQDKQIDTKQNNFMDNNFDKSDKSDDENKYECHEFSKISECIDIELTTSTLLQENPQPSRQLKKKFSNEKMRFSAVNPHHHDFEETKNKEHQITKFIYDDYNINKNIFKKNKIKRIINLKPLNLRKFNQN